MKKIFVKTKNVKEFIALMNRLENRPPNLPKIGLIYGEPGLGKTNAILWWALQNNAVIVTAKNKMTVRWFLSDLVEELGENPDYYCSDLFKQAVRLLVANPRTIIVDEIDYLTSQQSVIETLRDLHDRTGVPVLMVGMAMADKKLSRYKHLFDRVLEVYKFLPFDFEDVTLIIQTMSEVNISEGAISLVFKKLNRFRQIVKAVNKLEMIAETNNYTKITEKDLIGVK